jgi:hypothetical protein
LRPPTQTNPDAGDDSNKNNATMVPQSATSGDLQAKLAAMKAKLANLSQKK